MAAYGCVGFEVKYRKLYAYGVFRCLEHGAGAKRDFSASDEARVSNVPVLENFTQILYKYLVQG